MRETTVSRKVLAVMFGLAVFYVLDIGLDKLAMSFIPVETGLTVDKFLEELGLSLPLPTVFTVTKLVSALFAGVVGAFVLKQRAFVLLTIPVLVPDVPLYYVAFGEGRWVLVAKLFLTSTIPAVFFCLIGILLAAREEH